MLQSRPIDTGVLDTPGRVVLSFNVLVTKVPSEQFEEEVIKVLTTAGVGTENVNIFVSTKAQLPTGAGPYLSLHVGSGPGPINTQNVAGVSYERSLVQVVVRSVNYGLARQMAWAAFNALAVVHNQDIAA